MQSDLHVGPPCHLHGFHNFMSSFDRNIHKPARTYQLLAWCHFTSCFIFSGLLDHLLVSPTHSWHGVGGTARPLVMGHMGVSSWRSCTTWAAVGTPQPVSRSSTTTEDESAKLLKNQPERGRSWERWCLFWPIMLPIFAIFCFPRLHGSLNQFPSHDTKLCFSFFHNNVKGLTTRQPSFLHFHDISCQKYMLKVHNIRSIFDLCDTVIFPAFVKLATKDAATSKTGWCACYCIVCIVLSELIICLPDDEDICWLKICSLKYNYIMKSVSMNNSNQHCFMVFQRSL